MKLDETTIEEQAPHAAVSEGIRLEPHLFRVLECDRPLAGGARHSLRDVDRVLIGRGAELSIARSRVGEERRLELRVPGRFMSTTHATLTRGARGWVVEDVGSRNGTSLNGTRISNAELSDGDLLELGHTFFAFRTAMATPSDHVEDVTGHDACLNPIGLRTLLPALELRQAALSKVAASKLPLLLLGPTGSGKEVLARAIHALSGRTGPMVGVNCGALPPTLVESLLFGHVKGAFSGAVSSELGFMRAADRGTLLLDEIGDLPLASQVALLRVLEEEEIVPLGATRPVPVDVRVIAATHHPIDRLAQRGEFRSDLLGRLKGYTHPLVALRDRREDLGDIIAAMLPDLAGVEAERVQFSTDAARALLSYAWPLNIRELHQVLRSSLLLAKAGYVGRECLPAELLEPTEGASSSVEPIARGRAASVASGRLAESEDLKRALVDRLALEQGNVAAVARAMGKAPFQIHRWMKRFGIDPDSYRDRVR